MVASPPTSRDQRKTFDLPYYEQNEMLSFPKSIELAQVPTPLERVNFNLLDFRRAYASETQRAAKENNRVTLFIKRDDLTGSWLSGNKVRKLEYIYPDLFKNKSGCVITCGGVQSNHCRATAILAAKFGLKCYLILHPEPKDYTADGNLFFDKLVGAHIKFITDEEYLSVNQVMADWKADLEKKGERPYIIPEGASNELGSWGYISALREIKNQCRRMNLKPDRIVTAVGSGGTYAGLFIGAKLFGLNVRITGITVAYEAESLRNRISNLIESTIEKYRRFIESKRKIKFDREEIEIIDGYVGIGYAQSRPEELSLISDFARLTGILLDPAYTGKAMFGLLDLISLGKIDPKEKIIFLHTGGMFGLFPVKNQIV